MDIVIDFSTIPTDSPISFGWWFFKTIGWIIPVFLFIWAILLFWQAWIRNNYRKTRKYIILAIDIPKDNEQGPKAVENIFNQLAGAHQRLKFHEKWWTGEIPDSFSFEIVSIGGYIQFLVHLEERFRDLVEAMIYAQYTDAEIVEVEDYTKDWNFKFPNDKYDLWGTELKLGKKEYYPIRTYPEFEHIAEGYKDSMAGILEALTRIGPGEQIWIQIVTTPADNDWGEGAEPLIAKLIGAKDKTKKKWFDYIFDIPNIVVDAFNPPAEAPARTGPPEPPTQMLHMTEGQKFAVSAIEKKIGKLGFHTKIRIIYFAEKEKFNKPVAKVIYGGFKQFNTLDLNSFKPDKKTLTGGIVYFKKMRLKVRKNKILYRYKNRGHWLEPKYYGSVLNSEELASLYHFPTLLVKTPLVKKMEAKRAEPPMSLPIEETQYIKKADSTPKAGPPQDLPTG